MTNTKINWEQLKTNGGTVTELLAVLSVTEREGVKGPYVSAQYSDGETSFSANMFDTTVSDLKKRGIVIKHCTGDEFNNELWQKFSGYYEELDENGNKVFKRREDTILIPADQFYERGLQIKNYMTKFWKSPVKSFVVLDDDDGDLHLFGENFVQTRWFIRDCKSIDEEGLTEELAQKCVNILNRGE